MHQPNASEHEEETMKAATDMPGSFNAHTREMDTVDMQRNTTKEECSFVDRIPLDATKLGDGGQARVVRHRALHEQPKSAEDIGIIYQDLRTVGKVFHDGRGAPPSTKTSKLHTTNAEHAMHPAEHEAMMLQLVGSDIAPAVHNVEADTLYVQEVQGTPVSRLIADENWSAPAKADFVADAAEAVSKLQEKGVIHRDIKPDNMMVDVRGRVKLIDFGIALTTDEAQHLVQKTDDASRANQIAGSFHYMPPERVVSHIDAATDVFSLGAVFFEMYAKGHKKLMPLVFQKTSHTSPNNSSSSPNHIEYGIALNEISQDDLNAIIADNIEHVPMQELVMQMLQLDHTKRISASDAAHMAKEYARTMSPHHEGRKDSAALARSYHDAHHQVDTETLVPSIATRIDAGVTSKELLHEQVVKIATNKRKERREKSVAQSGTIGRFFKKVGWGMQSFLEADDHDQDDAEEVLDAIELWYLQAEKNHEQHPDQYVLQRLQEQYTNYL